MSDPWTFQAEPSIGGGTSGLTTLLDGTTFCISNALGDIEVGAGHGLFVADTRFVSNWRLRLDGGSLGSLSVIESDPSGGSFVSRLRPSPDRPTPAILVARERYVGEGMSELVRLENLSPSAVTIRLVLELGADFAHLFEVKEDRLSPRGFHSVEVIENEMRFDFRDGRRERRLSVSIPDGADAGPGRMSFVVPLESRASWSAPFEFTIRVDEVELHPRHRGGRPGPSASAAGYRTWHAGRPRFESSDEPFTRALARSVADIGALRIFDHELDDEAVIAAGAPWYMAMFGRDSLIASQMCLLLDPTMAAGTLRALARHQGRSVDPETEEEPGRILHEMRFRIDGGADGPGRSAYYGSIDSTPLFVCLLGEAVRFGLPESELAALLPVADAALSWIENYGDRDGDGFVEYERMTPRGLVNQGWKDSGDGINFADGTVANAPIALCEVQGYVYAAWLARAEIADHLGDRGTADRCRERAHHLRELFNERFYVESNECFAIALDGDKRQVDSVSSNIGHVLWSGICTSELADKIARHLVSPELFTGWGVRTLSSKMGAYNPMSYHNGSVWPHDTAIAVAGLVRYGFAEQAATIGLGLIAAADRFGGRLPELFCGFAKDEFAAPVSYPAACSPQAWASASLLSLVRSFVGIEANTPHHMLRLRPVVPLELGTMTVSGIPLFGTSVTVRATADNVLASGLPAGVSLNSSTPNRFGWSEDDLNP